MFSQFSKSIWTLAQDRHVICCGFFQGKTSIEYKIPTQGGFVSCMSVCPMRKSLIAFGVDDGMIRLLNLSISYKTATEVRMLWKMIKEKVKSVSFSG